MNKRDLEEAIRKEVEHWPGVEVEFKDATKGGHPKAKYTFDGKILQRPYASTPSDSAFGVHRMLGDHRRILKQLGATRDKPEPTKDEDEAPYRKPNDGAAKRPDPVKGEKAKPKTDVADKLVEAGAATDEQRKAIQAEASAATYEKRKAVEEARATGALLAKDLSRALGTATGVSDAPAERLLKQLRDRGCIIETNGTVSRSWVVSVAASMIEDGIYFGLPMEIYRNVPRLGAGSLIKLNQSPGDFWCGSWLDPDRKDEADEEKKAWQVVGEAYHCARLEPDEFEKRFCRKPSKADFAEQASEHGACWNGTEIGRQLGELGETKKRAEESVAEQAQRLEDAGYSGVIWPLEEARFQEKLGDRTPLDAKVWDEIVRDMDRLRGSKEIAAKLQDGAAEVSVFWTDENNIQRKARFDWLAREHWVDFKTFDNSQGRRLEQAISNAIRFNRYYITAASYFDAAEMVRTGGLEIVGEATDFERELIAHLQIRPEHLECWFVFQQKSGVPNLLARRFPFFDVPSAIENSWDTGADEEAQARGHEATRRPTLLYQKGRAEIGYAKKLFATYSQVYQPGEPWAPLDPVGTISELDFAPAWLEGRYE